MHRTAATIAQDTAAGGSLRAGLGLLHRAWLDRRRRIAARREFEQLDAAGLRDLALTASEFESFWAECTGSAPATRRRVRR